MTYTTPVLALVLTAMLAGCAGSPSSGGYGGQSSEARCKTSANPSGCRIQHDLAGGPPINLVKGR